MLSLLDPNHLLSAYGAIGVGVVLFAETGLLIGFFLPGDTLLLTAGVLAATPATAAAHVSLTAVLVGAAVGALVGAQTGFVIGRRLGPALLGRRDGKLKDGLDRAQKVLDRYGQGRAVVLARFLPVVRTLMNPAVGALGMTTRSFTLWQVVGGLVWSCGVTLAGYFVGARIPGLETYLLPVVAVVVLLTLLPALVAGVRGLRGRRS